MSGASPNPPEAFDAGRPDGPKVRLDGTAKAGPGPAGRVDPDTVLGGFAAIGVVGDRLDEVAAQAVRLAKEEAPRRPVLVFNLLGDTVAPARLVADDDPQGISDAVRFGITPQRVARILPGTPQVSVVPGGSESPLHLDVLSDRAWERWIESCRRSGTLCVIAAPADRDDVGVLLDRLDGLVVVGDAIPFSRAPVLRRIRVTRPERARRRSPVTTTAPQRRRRLLHVAWGAGALVVAAVAWASRGLWMRGEEEGPLTLAAGGSVTGSPLPFDTSRLAPWSVELASVNSAGGALLRVRQIVDSVPVPTYSATAPGATPAPWYLLLAGAYAAAPSAESLLVALRDRGVVEAAAGRVVRTPYAWLLERDVPANEETERLFMWRQLGLPAYALWDQEGSLRIYAGAFETEAQAQLFAPTLDSLDIHATLVPRVGSIR